MWQGCQQCHKSAVGGSALTSSRAALTDRVDIVHKALICAMVMTVELSAALAIASGTRVACLLLERVEAAVGGDGQQDGGGFVCHAPSHLCAVHHRCSSICLPLSCVCCASFPAVVVTFVIGKGRGGSGWRWVAGQRWLRLSCAILFVHSDPHRFTAGDFFTTLTLTCIYPHPRGGLLKGAGSLEGYTVSCGCIHR